MPRAEAPSTTSETGVDQATGRVWAQTTVKINLGDYENMEFSFGASMPCRNTAVSRKRMMEKLSQEQGVMLSSRIEEAREIWSNK